jgi:hypothetical protein
VVASNAAKIREWSTRFERFRRSAKTVSRFCRDEQVSIQAFYYWRDRVQANSRDELQSDFRNDQSLATGNVLAIGKASVIGQQVIDSESECVRLVIRIGAISIECYAKTNSAIDAVLSWASRNQDGPFKQLIAR